MSLKINDIAPDFTQDSTIGPLHFHEWAGNDWVLFFSHPKDFTPVCTTELGEVARLKPEFDKRGVKALGLSVDPADNHARWGADIVETQGHAPNFPMIADTDLSAESTFVLLTSNTGIAEWFEQRFSSRNVRGTLVGVFRGLAVYRFQMD